MFLLIAIFLFLFVVVLLCVGFGRAVLVSRQKQQIRTMLRRAETPRTELRRPELLKKDNSTDALSQALLQWSAFRTLSLFLAQSGAGWTLSKFAGFTVVAGLMGLFFGTVLPPFSNSFLLSLVPALGMASLPALIIKRKRSKRFAAFEEQFPEALNFLSRSMRAGHAFSIGLEMLVNDAPDPLNSTFRIVMSELQLGSSFESALDKMTLAVPLVDVRFFVSAVLLQQGSGGNLGEILDSMATIIRDRFRLKGQIKAASAHGRVTGLILALMPVVVAGILFVISPEYLLILSNDPDGRHLVTAAGVGQIIGFLCIRKIVNIKV